MRIFSRGRLFQSSRLAWQSNAWSERKSSPCSSRWVAKQCRSEWGLMFLLIPQSRMTCLIAFWTPPLPSRICICISFESISKMVKFNPSLSRSPMEYRVKKNTWYRCFLVWLINCATSNDDKMSGSRLTWRGLTILSHSLCLFRVWR